ncbi:MAG: HU family DNA-binding protein [Fusobacterium sp.]|uniref:HU family DNA-binding protein n=1 Tax=Fusobacterium sp. TaxID=68766 RepID=UPI002A766122|nr:HU family DNA-binding protein [Fusobacterium sp.]MDY3060636.1 HU family DNA-binding protein [Fusobacterium sp.]
MTEKNFLLLYKNRKKLKFIEKAEEKLETFLDSIDYALSKDKKLIFRDWIITRKVSKFAVKNRLKRKNIKYRNK